MPNQILATFPWEQAPGAEDEPLLRPVASLPPALDASPALARCARCCSYSSAPAAVRVRSGSRSPSTADDEFAETRTGRVPASQTRAAWCRELTTAVALGRRARRRNALRPPCGAEIDLVSVLLGDGRRIGPGQDGDRRLAARGQAAGPPAHCRPVTQHLDHAERPTWVLEQFASEPPSAPVGAAYARTRKRSQAVTPARRSTRPRRPPLARRRRSGRRPGGRVHGLPVFGDLAGVRVVEDPYPRRKRRRPRPSRRHHRSRSSQKTSRNPPTASAASRWNIAALEGIGFSGWSSAAGESRSRWASGQRPVEAACSVVAGRARRTSSPPARCPA